MNFKAVSGSTNIHVNANQCLKECSRLANENLKLNLGCGAELLPDYINIDLQDFHNPGRFYYVKSDAGKLNFLKDKVVKEILCKQLIEHIHPLLIKEFFYEWRRVLRPDGLLILLFPDFDRIIDKYQSIKNLNSVQDLMDFLDLNYGVLNTTMNESLVKADRHRCLMTRRFLDIMLGSEGFKIKSYESIDRCCSKLIAEKVWTD